MVSVPVVTSGDLLLRGSFDTTSANFVPALNPLAVTSAAWRAGVGPGSAACVLPLELVQGLAYAKLEMSVAQGAPRVFIVATKW